MLDLVSDRCPVMYVAQYNDLFAAYQWSVRGHLPFAGGWAEQPADLITGLGIVYGAIADADEKEAKAAERLSK